MTLVIGALTMGLILSLLGLGVFISFRIFTFADITVEGSITLGASVAAVLLVDGVHPIAACLLATGAGAAAGAITATVHTRFNVNRLLSGIIVMTALYSVNLRIMGRSNLPLISERTLASMAEQAGIALAGGARDVHLWGWEIAVRDAAMLVVSAAVAAAVLGALYAFFRTHLGTAMQAAGDNAEMGRALGVNVDTMTTIGLSVSNGLAGLAGALLAQYQGFADVQMGIGTVVWGLASVIIGEALVGVKQLGYLLTGAVMGSVLFRLLIAIALRGGLNPNDLKLVTAAFVLVALMLPRGLHRAAGWRRQWTRRPAPAAGTP